MARRVLVRTYTIDLPDDRHEYDRLMRSMIRADPEVTTGNYGDPDPKWLEDCLLSWLAFRYEEGSLRPNIVEVVENILEGEQK
jgi:hypothetical protein